MIDRLIYKLQDILDGKETTLTDTDIKIIIGFLRLYAEAKMKED